MHGNAHIGGRLYWRWRDYDGLWRWPNFTPGELACRCAGRYCDGEYWHDSVFMDALQMVRDAMAAPLIITSGHRCALWNAHVGGAPASAHKLIAADIALAGHDRGRLLNTARRAGFGAIGLYRSFMHVDLRPGRRWFGAGARPVWADILENSEEGAWWR